MDEVLEITENKKIKIKKSIIHISIIIFSICLVYGIVKLINNHGNDAKAILIIIESFVSIIIPFLFPLIEKIFKIKIGTPIYLITIVFLFLSVTLGETLNFYENIHGWDKLLHITSGFMLTFAGYCFIIKSLHDLPIKQKVSLGICYSVFFALAFLMCWEIIEFLVDTICGTNMQKFIPDNFLNNGGNSFDVLNGTSEEIGEYFKNPSGYKFPLMDTMNDLITGFLGSIACCLILIKTGKKYDKEYSKIIINKTPK